MTFNSVEFALLLAIVLAVHWTAPRRWRNLVILVASYTFYGWWDARFLGLLIASTFVDYTLSRAIARRDDAPVRRRLLAMSIASNLGLLATFKYFGFFAESLTALLGLSANPVLLDIVLPVGISFYTFQTMAYTIDVYRGRVAPASSLLTFATFVAYFPQLVAGPIERAERLLPQIADRLRPFPDAEIRAEAGRLILLGLVRKIVIADGVAPIVNDVYASSGDASAPMLAVAVLGFAIQLYGDFAGYSAIARGVSLLLGIRLMVNFTEPHLSADITEFWQRWHISLSTWLRDYLYIPLGGNRGSRYRTLRNLLVTMLLGGLWHGAAWTFVLWGGLHGTYLAVHRALPERRADAGFMPLRVAGTFGLVALTLIPFRSDGLAQTADVLGGLVSWRSGAIAWVDVALVLSMLVFAFGSDVMLRRASERDASARPDLVDDPSRPAPTVLSRPLPGGLAVGVSAALLVLFSGGVPEPFIYFQF